MADDVRSRMADDIRPRLPKRIALVTVAETHALPSLIANDFEDALGAYSKIGGTKPPEVLHSLEDDPAIDAVVIMFAASDARLAAGLLASLESTCLVYALASDDAEDAENALRALDALKDTCNMQRLSWRGGLAVPCCTWYEAHMTKPRMGSARRSLSEATDDVVLALRCDNYAGVSAVKAPLRARISALKTPVHG